MPEVKKHIPLAILAGLILAITPTTSSNAADDYATQILSTSAQIVFTGTAALTPSVSISEEIQIQPLTADFSKDPIGWDMTLWSEAGIFFGHVHWYWSKATGPGFSWNMADANHTNSNLGGATCSDTDGFCYLDTPNWNLSDPFRVNIGADNSLGAGWWKATILDLANGQMLNLGSMSTPRVVNLTNLVVKQSIYRTTAVSACPGDLAPTADTYFGPIVDSTGAEELLPTLKTTSNPCINASLSTLPTIVGGFLLYGGSKADLSTAPRANLFTPSPLITSAIPPTPDVPTNFVETANNGVLKLIVQVPNFQSKGIKSIYLVSPELGFPSATPINTNVIGDTGQISFPILPGFINTPINLSFYASNGYFVSDPLTTSITIPPAASPPVQVPGIGGAHSAPGGITNAPTTSEVPSAPQGVKTSIAKGQLIITANSVQRNGTKVSGALLVSTPLGFTSAAPKQGAVTSGKLQFKVALTKAMSGKTIPFTIYLYNDLGVSGASSGKVKVP